MEHKLTTREEDRQRITELEAEVERLRDEVGDGFEGIEIDSGPDNPHGIERGAHSVVTGHLTDEAGHPTREALDRVLEFFAERLRPSGQP